MKDCKPTFEKCIIDKCPYFNLYKEIVHGEMHIRLRCKEKDIQITKESTMKEYIFARPNEMTLKEAVYDANFRGELIRCKDCVHYTGLTASGAWGRCNVHGRTCQDCDYCSWAEREEE